MNTVSIATIEDKLALQALWADAFNDEPDLIAHFLDKVFVAGSSISALVAKHNDNLCGMLFLLPASLYIKKEQYLAGYIYAVATDNAYKNQGVMKELEKAACKLAMIKKMRIVFLVPQEKSLFTLYEKMGYRIVSYKEETRITPQNVANYSLDLSTKEQFLYRRSLFLSDKSAYFELTKEVRDYCFEQANEYGSVLFYADNQTSGYLVVEQINGICKIKETDLSINGIAKATFALSLQGLQYKNIVACNMGRRKPFAMAKSLDNSLNPFDIEKENTYCALMLE